MEIKSTANGLLGTKAFLHALESVSSEFIGILPRLWEIFSDLVRVNDQYLKSNEAAVKNQMNPIK